MAMLAPGQGKVHKAYVWAYGTTCYDSLQAVVYDFAGGLAFRSSITAINFANTVAESTRRFLASRRPLPLRRAAVH